MGDRGGVSDEYAKGSEKVAMVLIVELFSSGELERNMTKVGL